jgi:hypothetical protein
MKNRKLVGGSIVLACILVGAVAAASSSGPEPTGVEHSTGNEARTAQQCRANADVMRLGLLDWCLKCVSLPNQHYHPLCPAGARCSPNNGANQCGGGSF